MLEFFTHMVERYGYFAVVLFVALEGLGLPLPGETAVVTAAAFAARGSLSALGVAASAVLGTMLGGTGGYWIGRRGGRGMLERHGHWIRLDAARLARSERYFARYGALTIFFARFVALLRIFGCILAGVSQMPFATFSAMNLAGGLVWAACFTALGVLFGRNLSRLEGYLDEITIVVTVVVVVVVVVMWWRARHRSPNHEIPS